MLKHIYNSSCLRQMIIENIKKFCNFSSEILTKNKKMKQGDWG